MRQDELHPGAGAKKATKRIGRGYGSGHGACSGRGNKGQKSRSGHDIPKGFEGGQMPLIKRLPQKRGFKNIFRVEYNLVNLQSLNIFKSGSEVTPEKLLEAGLIKNITQPVKILANGELEYPLTVKANKFSETAKAKIEKLGGKAEELENAAETK
ncbi:MAG: 50S ribosomal protein L15 [Dehalococcoidales bacterium]|nr:50S ribosomal protein L15 [Dehalococcoidales bacterium]